MLVDALATFIFVLTYLYSLATFVMDFEFDIYPYDYLPFIRIDIIRKITIWFIYLPLILNTSAVKKVEPRITAIVCLLLSVVIKNIMVGGLESFWAWAVLAFIGLIADIVFFGITFKAKPFMNAFMILLVFIRILNVVFRILDTLLQLHVYIPFSTHYISTGSGLLFYFFLVLYMFTLLGRSTAVKNNMNSWNYELSTTTSTVTSTIPSNTISSTSPTRTDMVAKTYRGSATARELTGDETYAVPRAVFWCSSCNAQKKPKITQTNIYEQHPCPTCGKPLLAWWNKSPKKKYYQFIVALIFMGGSMFTILIENVLNEGLYAVTSMMVIGVIYIAIYLALFLPVVKLKVTEPSAEAGLVLPHGVHERFVSEMIKVVVFAIIGGLFLFGLARGITGIIIAII